MSRRDLYDNLEYEQVRRSQRGLRPMSALGGIIDGFEQGYTAVDSFKRKKELERQSDEDRRDKKRDEAFKRANQDAAFKKIGKKYGLSDKEFVSRADFEKKWDSENPSPKSEKSVLDKAIDYTSEKFGQAWRNLGFKSDDAPAKGKTTEEVTPIMPEEDSSDPYQGLRQPEMAADGGLMGKVGRGLLRAAEGTPGGVEEAAAAQGVQPPQSMGIAPKEPKPNQKAQAPITTPYDDIAKANPKAAEFIRQMGQDPSANLKEITEDNAMFSLLELTKDNPNYGKLSEYAGVIKTAKDEGVFRMLQELEMQTKDKKTYEETKKKAIGYFNSMGNEGGLVDVEAVPMTYKAPSGETLSYNRWRMKMDDGTTGLIDTRDLLMQVLSVKGLMQQENQWTNDKFARERIEEGKKDRAQRQSEQKDARRENDFRRNSQDIDRLLAAEAKSIMGALPKSSTSNIASIVLGNSASEEQRKMFTEEIASAAIAELRNTDAYRTLDKEDSYKDVKSKLTENFRAKYKEIEQRKIDERREQLGEMYIDAMVPVKPEEKRKALEQFVNDNRGALNYFTGKKVISAKDIKEGSALDKMLRDAAVRSYQKNKLQNNQE